MSSVAEERARLLLWGDDLASRGLTADAAALYGEAADLDPTDVHARLALARCLLVWEKPHRVLAELDGAAALEATDEVRGAIMATRSAALVQGKRPKEALTAAREAVRLAPDDLTSRYWLVCALLADGLVEEASHEAGWLEEVAPDFALTHYAAALVAAQTGDVAEVESRLRRAVEADPEDALTMVQLGGLLLAQRRDRLALEVFLDAVKERPDLEPARRGALAAIARLRRRPQRAWLALVAWVGLFVGRQALEWERRVGWAILGGAAVALVAFLGHAFLHRGVPLPPDARRLISDERWRGRRWLSRVVALGVVIAFGIMGLVVVSVGTAGGYAIASLMVLAAVLGVLRLGRWNPRQPSLRGATCRCVDLSVVDGKPAARYAARHLQTTAQGLRKRQELWCGVTGTRWLGHGTGGRYRLIRLSDD